MIEHGRRRVHLAGLTAHPHWRLLTQQARNLLMALGDRAEQIATLIIPGHGAPFEPDSNTSPLTGPE